MQPEMTAGAATGVPLAIGLDFPTDLAFSPDGDLYVVEFYAGTMYRFNHTGRRETPRLPGPASPGNPFSPPRIIVCG